MKIPYKPKEAQYYNDEWEYNGDFFQVHYNCIPIINKSGNEDIELQICGMKMFIGETPDDNKWAIVIQSEEKFFEELKKAFTDFVFDSMDPSEWNDINEIIPEPTTKEDY